MTKTTRSLVVVVSGLPAAGKSTIARSIAPLLDLPVIDKDDLLEASFPSGEVSPVERSRLSRQADATLQQLVQGSLGAVVASHWRRPELSSASGTPTEWLSSMARVVEVHCTCDPHTAAERFVNRSRHPAHGDQRKGFAEVLEQFQAIRSLGPLRIGPTVTIATDTPVDPIGVVDQILAVI